MSLVDFLTPYNVTLDKLAILLQGSTEHSYYSNAIDNLQLYKWEIVIYNFVICTVAMGCGLLFKFLIRYFKIDRKSMYFRFPNRWYYVFNGELLDFPEIPDSSDDINTKVVDALVSVNGQNIIYIGYLYDYQLKSDGSLDSILLQYPMRRDLNGQPGTYYEIASRFMMLKYEHISNINFRYYHID